MAQITGSFALITRAVQRWNSPSQITGAFALTETATFRLDGSAFSLVPVTPGSLTASAATPGVLTLAPVTPGNLGTL